MEHLIEKCTDETVIDRVVFLSGVLHAIPLSRVTLAHPYRTLFFAVSGGSQWLLYIRIMKWLRFPRDLQGLLIPMTVASLLYLKYSEYYGRTEEEDVRKSK